MDLAIILILIILTIIFMRKFSNIVYLICIIDIFLRLLHNLEKMLGVREFSILVNKYFHNSILDIASSYTSGIFYTIIAWVIFGIYVVFLFYVIRTFFRKKK
ncbi:MAG: hypothetical protein PUD07_03085 [bacterium]|nr:hypothetical protein [bacterium]